MMVLPALCGRESTRVNQSRTVTNAVAMYSELGEQSQMQIGERNAVKLNVPSALEVARSAACQDEGNVVGRMGVAVGNAGAEHHGHVVQQRAVAVLRVTHLFEKISEHSDVVGVDLGNLRHLLGLAVVVRNRVVRVGNTDLRIRHTAVLVAN